MATAAAPRKVRRRSFDNLRQKLWAVPARLRLKLAAPRAQRPGRSYRRA